MTTGDAGERAPLPATAAATTPEAPWPVRLLSQKIADYVDRMSALWVEGQLVEVNRRPGARTAFLTMRDTDAEMSLRISIAARALPAEVAPGAHVVAHAKPSFWTKNGSFNLWADDLRAIGVGGLLARIEALRKVLAAEGLFDDSRKRPLPFLPRAVGLVCGRDAKAKDDVLTNARLRWPAVRFEVREVAVQGVSTVPEVSAALAELDAIDEVDVVVVARGGGSVEDLFPFSNEALVRAVAGCRTPVVSAIGHEGDSPLIDLVADVRASTPTDAARRVVPDFARESAGVADARERVRRAVVARLERAGAELATLRGRPVLARPESMLEGPTAEVVALRGRNRGAFDGRLTAASAELARAHGGLLALSPASTLARGYAVLRRQDGTVVRDQAEVVAGDRLEAILHAGRLGVEVVATREV
ncbi:exodeoxyribonuclease VII large subunit [Georgenia sp. Z1491]|uniref:exodeoxyribonuclease VII large subunit n=1 Tax=Georgenia sp. Z1491 TaxID=3416707 RepID=UPI003CF41439